MASSLRFATARGLKSSSIGGLRPTFAARAPRLQPRNAEFSVHSVVRGEFEGSTSPKGHCTSGQRNDAPCRLVYTWLPEASRVTRRVGQLAGSLAGGTARGTRRHKWPSHSNSGDSDPLQTSLVTLFAWSDPLIPGPPCLGIETKSDLSVDNVRRAPPPARADSPPKKVPGCLSSLLSRLRNSHHKIES